MTNFILTFLLSFGIIFNAKDSKILWSNNELIHEFKINGVTGKITKYDVILLELLKLEVQDTDRFYVTSDSVIFVSYKGDSVSQVYKKEKFVYSASEWNILINYLK